MKLTLTFLAALAAADAANTHGRRHLRRQNDYYGGGYPGGEKSSVALPITNSTSKPIQPSSTPVELPSSSPEAVSSFPTPSGTGPIYTPYPTGEESSKTPEVGTGEVPPYPSTGVVPGTGYPTGTGAVPTEYTTSTIYSTQIVTVTVSGTKETITSVVPVGTTVCPKTTPAPTGVPVEGGEHKPEVETVKTPITEITHVETKTYTYTVGTGQSAHLTTTETVSTSTETIYSTIYITKAASPTGYPEGGENGHEEEPEETTTIKTTSTTTKFVTVYPTPASTVNAEGSVVPTGEGECAPPVTVTVTAQETVTVTAGDVPPHSTGSPEEEVPAVTPPSVYPTGAPSAPYPISNGTVPSNPTSGSSGFLTFTKPVYPTGPVETPSAGVPEASVSSFLFPSEVGTEVPSKPTETPEATTAEVHTPTASVSASSVPVPEATSPVYPEYPVATPTPGSGYGSYRKRFGLF